MESEEEETFQTTLFDLPVEDLLVSHLAKYLKLRDIFNFRCCSRYSKQVGDAMLSDLQELTLKYPIMPYNEITFRVILQECHRLRKICVDLNRSYYYFSVKLTDEAIRELLDNNPHVDEIEIDIGNSASDNTIKVMILLATNCKDLTKFTFRGYLPVLPVDGFLKTLTQYNNHLLEVNLTFAIDFCEGEAEDFFKNQPKLQRISLPPIFGNEHFTYIQFHRFTGPAFQSDKALARTLSTIADVCKDLKYLKIQWFGIKQTLYGALTKIVENCPKLHTINFSSNSTISDEVLSYLKSKNIQAKGIKSDDVKR